MRVAILGQFPLDVTRLGGVEVAIIYLMDTLHAIGVDDLHIITCRTGLTQAKTVSLHHATVYYLPRWNWGRITWHVRERRRIQALLHDLHPDIVHAHGTGLYAHAALGSGFPNVITAHGIVAREVALYRGWGLRLRGLFDIVGERYCLAQATDIIAISPYVEQVFRPFTGARFYLIENAVDQAFFRLSPRPDPGRLLFAGPVIERKGLVPLVRALAKIKERQPHVELRVAGGTGAEPQYYQALVSLARGLGVSAHVSFLGQLDQERLLAEYAACSLFVLPSFQETAPMAVQQALAARVPVVATSVGGVPTLVKDGETGLLVPCGDSDALAAAILRVLDDDDLRARMGEQARRDARQRFLPEVVADKTKAVYDAILRRANIHSVSQRGYV